MNFFETSGWRIGSLFGVDISLSMGFMFIIIFNMAIAGVYTGLIFAITLFVSLVIHEMGHAVVAKRYDLDPSEPKRDGFPSWSLPTVLKAILGGSTQS